MQRQIKFRAWDKKKNEMLPYSQLAMLFAVVQVRGNDLELMQFTGLLDKHGKEIYEGDIVKLVVGGNEVTTSGDIKWEDESAQFIVSHPSGYHGAFGLTQKIIWACEYEVIGNIYENPGLLGEPK